MDKAHIFIAGFVYLLSGGANAALVEAQCAQTTYTAPVYTQCSLSRSTVPAYGTDELTGTSFASANLSTGQLRAIISTESASIPGTGGAAESSPARARLYETITILGDWTGELTVPITMSTDGRFYHHVGQGIGGTANMQIAGMDPSHAGTVGMSATWDGESGLIETTTSGSGIFSSNVFSDSRADFRSDITLNFTVTPDNPVISFRATLHLNGGSIFNTDGISVLDFGNTSGMSLVLPDNLSYTSESGVFLSAVPVPAAVWLFSSGLIALFGFIRKK